MQSHSNSSQLCYGYWQTTSKDYREKQKKAENTTQYWRRKKKSEDWDYPTSSLSKSYSNQDSVVLGKDTQTDQWIKTENPKIDIHKYGHLICDEGAKAV